MLLPLGGVLIFVSCENISYRDIYKRKQTNVDLLFLLLKLLLAAKY